MDDGVKLTPREKAFLDANPDAEMGPTYSELKGIGGWLGFLSASLVFLGPLVSIFSTLAQHSSAKALNPEISASPLWYKAQVIDWTSTLAYCVISVIAGILLIERWKSSTVPIVIACIWLAGPGLATLSLLVLDALVPGGANASDVGLSLGRPLIYSVIWTMYLLLSRRVKNTYRGDNV